MTDRLQESAHLDELDLSLVNTLQIDPRAPWSRIGRALDLDPVTVARRWSRLTETGVAWITAQPGRAQISQGCLAFVEVDCRAGRTLDVANTLARWPHVLTVDHTSGGRDLLLTVSTPTLASLSRYLLERLGSLPGISATRTQLGTHVFAHATDWRLRSLDPRQRAHITAERPPRSPSTPQTLTARDRLLIVRLGADGRTSLTDLAEELGVGITTVRKRLALLIANEDLELRCEVAQPLCGWPISTSIWAQAEIGDRDTLNRLLAAVPEIRACIGLAGGTANLLISVWLRSLSDIRGLEARLAGALPRLKVLDQAVSLRFVKRMGRVLDPAGRSVSTVPMDIWSEPS
ncbi:Lrp/AsnC family transcriptional regulator [Streptomyces sp. NPDC051742]|uniref:Lrp/AsnC family transcriptional regulator n=1 Tax=unclassified Streptomyces TaxID=2593676 RepID=UPI0034382328